MFIGTPHNGVIAINDGGSDESMIKLLNFYLDSESPVEEALRKQCAEIAAINDTFANCGQPLEILSYHEDDEVHLGPILAVH